MTTLALRELEDLDFQVATVPSFTPVHKAVLRSPQGKEYEAPLPTNGLFAAVARREELDAALVLQATQAGTPTLFGQKVTEAQASSDSITLTLDSKETVRASQCLAADGMWSPLRKMLGLGLDGYRGEWHAFRQYFTNVGPRASTDLHIWFEQDILPGYLWSFPIGDNGANVGFGILRGGTVSTQEMKTLWPELLARPHIRDVLGDGALPEAPHRAWPIPARIDGVPLTGPRTLFLGDAAAACDPLTGEGIGQALATGRQAAACLLNEQSFGAASARYGRALRNELFADHRMALRLGSLMSNPSIAEASLRAVGTNGWTRRNFARWMFEDYPRSIVTTPRRWKRGLLSRDGSAYDVH